MAPIEAVRACGLANNAVVNVRKRLALEKKCELQEAELVKAHARALRDSKRVRTAQPDNINQLGFDIERPHTK